jgi:hypothetical protein
MIDELMKLFIKLAVLKENFFQKKQIGSFVELLWIML